jgi:hypothetical protein
MTRPADIEVPLRITVVNPVPGVGHMLQRGTSELVPASARSAKAISFDFTLRLGPAPGAALRWLGPSAEGPASGRFVYVCIGKRTGQPESPWDRRAKIQLGAITRAQVDAVLAKPGLVLEARYDGVAKDGGPACATVPLVDGAWRVTKR